MISLSDLLKILFKLNVYNLNSFKFFVLSCIILSLAYVAGVKRARGRGNLGTRDHVLTPFPFPFERLPRRLVSAKFHLLFQL